MKEAFKIGAYTWLTWLFLSLVNVDLLGWFFMWPASLFTEKPNYIFQFLPFLSVPLIFSILVMVFVLYFSRNKLIKLPLFASVLLMNVGFFLALVSAAEAYKQFLIKREAQLVEHDCFYEKSFIGSVRDWNGEFGRPHAEIGKDNKGSIWSYREMKFIPNTSKDLHLMCSNNEHTS